MPVAADAGSDHIVHATTFRTDPETRFEAIMKVKGGIFPQAPYPTWRTVGVNWLAGFDFGIKVIARLPKQPRMQGKDQGEIS